MQWVLFIARRIYQRQEGGKEVSKPAVRIAMAGIAIGLAVMIVSVAVAIGFKHEIRNKVVGLTSDVVVTSLDDAQLYQTRPVVAGDSLLERLKHVQYVQHVQRYSTKTGMIMTSDNFQGMMLKGVGQEYDFSFLREHLVEGEIPLFTDSVSSNKVLVSKSIADKLSLRVGDRLLTYYVEDNVRARKLVVAGIYQTNFAAYDDFLLLTDMYTVNRLNKWRKDQVGGIEMDISDYSRLNEVNDHVRSMLFEESDHYGESYFCRSVEEANPQIFAWLNILDVNVWVILILMTGVAGFTMISGLLIIILDRTNMIGVLKALGADNTSIRKIFLSFSAFQIGKGMLWGNVIGISLCVIQILFQPIKLDPADYYVASVPLEFNLGILLLLNVCTFLVSLLMLIGPSYLISKIHPARSIRFE